MAGAVFSHCYVQGGDLGDPSDPPTQVGLLGCEFAVENGAYRITKLYQAPNWHAELRAPLTEPGVDVKVGDYLLALDGMPLSPAENIYKSFEMTAGRLVHLTVCEDPDLGCGEEREVSVVAISGAQEAAIRAWSWAEERRAIVEELSDGKLGYICALIVCIICVVSTSSL